MSAAKSRTAQEPSPPWGIVHGFPAADPVEDG